MKKNLISTLLMMLVMTGTAMAGTVSQKEAQSIASDFFASHFPAAAKSNGTLSIANAFSLAQASGDNPSYYIFNAKDVKGYVIVSGEDRLPNILCYSLDGSWPTDSNLVPPALKSILKNYAAYVEAIRGGKEEAPALRILDGRGTPVVEPLIKTTWGQTYPYNKYAPECPDTLFEAPYHSHFPIGCVATAMSQIINYWAQKTGKPVSPANHDTFASYKDYFQPDAPYKTIDFSLNNTTKYDWANMPDSIGYRADTLHVMSQEEWEKESEAVGVLLRDVAYSMNMDWDNSGGGAVDAFSPDIFSSVFGFSYDSYYIHTSDSGQMIKNIDIIKADLDKGWPVLADGNDEEGGHCFLYDGYDSNDFVHVNWGWNGECNSYFDLTYLKTNLYDPNARHNYNFSQKECVIVGIHPMEDGETPRIDNNNILFENAGLYISGMDGYASEKMMGLKFKNGSRPVAYLDKEKTKTMEYFQADAFHKSNGYDYDFNIVFKNTDDGTEFSDTIHDETTKQPSRNMSGNIFQIKELDLSKLTDGKYEISCSMREALNGEVGEWLTLENPDSILVSGKHLVMTPNIYNQYYHGKECIHFYQDGYNNALIHMEFTKDPMNLNVGDTTYIILEHQLAAATTLNYDSLADQHVIVTATADGTTMNKTAFDMTEKISTFLERAKASTSHYSALINKVSFVAPKSLAGKTMHLTYTWPALKLSMTNDIKIIQPTGIDKVMSKGMLNSRRYNLAGQTVSDSYHGIVIQDGKKCMIK